jgi:hypothetical protein
MTKIQIITIGIDILFLFYVARLIIKGKLREEYAIVWLICTAVLLLFSFWAKGLEVMSHLFGVYEPANLVFTGFIFIILIYLLHLSVVNSKLQRNMTKITQELALMKEKAESEANTKEEVY